MLLYEDFEIKIDRQEEGKEYLVSATTSGGDSAQGRFVLPLDLEELERLLLLIENTLLRSRHPSRRIRPAEFRRIQQAGRQLYGALFQEEIRTCYNTSFARAQQMERGLRVKLRLDYTLTNVPWELMYNPDSRDFVALSTHTPIVRYLELPQSLKPLKVSLPLRILVVIANAYDQSPLDVAGEKERLLSALDELREAGAVEIEFLEGPGTFSALQRILRQKQFHVLHFIGHGEYREEAEEGFLILEDEQGKSWFINGENLGRTLRDHFPLRLVVLNACEGAKTSITDPFAGMAAAIVGAGIPAVVAMQFDISDWGAIIFSREFYISLVDGYPLDAAVTEARKAMAAFIKNSIEWSTPVLYMTTPDGVIFDLTETVERSKLIPEEKRKKEKLSILYDQALRQMRKEEWDRSIDLFEQLLDIGPDYRDAPQKLAEAKTRKQRAEKKPAPAPSPAPSWLLYVLGGGAALLILVLGLIAYSGSSLFLRPTATPTATLTPTATRTATPTLTATETATTTLMGTVTPSPSTTPSFSPSPTRPPSVIQPTLPPYRAPTYTPTPPKPPTHTPTRSVPPPTLTSPGEPGTPPPPTITPGIYIQGASPTPTRPPASTPTAPPPTPTSGGEEKQPPPPPTPIHIQEAKPSPTLPPTIAPAPTSPPAAPPPTPTIAVREEQPPPPPTPTIGTLD